jgi:hypothetical protein
MIPKQQSADRAPGHGPLVVGLVILLLAGLPLATWMDMRNLSENILRRQADEVGRIINDMRNFYATDVVGRVLASTKPRGPCRAPITATCRARSRSRPRCRSSSAS